MTTLEFGEKYFYGFSRPSDQMRGIELFDYQKELLRDFDEQKYLAIKHSRQIGLTSMLVLKICNFLVNNTDKINKTIVVMSDRLSYSESLMEMVRITLYHYNQHIQLTRNNRREIETANGNLVKVISNIDGIRGCNINSIIIDNANFVKNLDEVIPTFMIFVQQIILVSNNKKGQSYFNDLFHKETCFLTKKIYWHQRPDFTPEWYEAVKNGGTDMAIDVDLDYFPEELKKEPKNRIINVRLDDETINNIAPILIEKDVSISQYIRGLVKEDCAKFRLKILDS